MSPERAPPRHALLLGGLAAIGSLVPVIGGARWFQVALTAVVGVGAVCCLLDFGRRRRSAARTQLLQVASGRISERGDALHVVLDLPGAGIEPWRADAWVVGVVSAASVFMGLSSEPLTRPFAFVQVVLTAALGLRLFAAPADHIRLGWSADGWWVQANEGGRHIRRAGNGQLVPELLVDALVLWSSDGRVGVLRGELEPEERAWLSERLNRARPAPSSGAPNPARRQIEQAEAGEHG
ncbi:MAG: hypothetical protein QM756_26190 [Polyangiaceae bacterium]